MLVLLVLASCTTPSVPTVDLTQARWFVSTSSGKVDSVLAKIPGHVLPSLVKSGLAPDPYFGTHERDVQWVEDETWTYTTVLDASPFSAAVDSAILSFECLDTYARVLVNDQTVLTADNAHRHWTTAPFPLAQGPIAVSVVFDPVAARGQERLDAHGVAIPASNESRPLGSQTSPVTRKPGYQFGWDWGPRLAGPGIAGPVVLEPWIPAQRKAERLPWLEVVQLSDREARLVMHDHRNWGLGLTLNGNLVGVTVKHDTLVIRNPQLWWPVHMGAQPLYTCTWTHSKTGQCMERNLGIRMLEWREEGDAWGTSFGLHVNGRPVHAKGANVVPPDFHEAHSDKGWRHIVANAKAANMNMVRVWGGGVYPPDAFFNACDREGILVWQDFMFACAMVPDDERFTMNVMAEAEQHVQRLRHHPSLALWCGNNEVERAWTSWGWQDMYNLHGPDSVRLAEAYQHLFHDLLPDLVARESPTRYLPTSPTLDARSGDEHAWGVWFGLEDFSYYSRHDGRFASEYGLQSLPDMHTLREAGISKFNDDALQFRQRSQMDWLEPGFDGWDMMAHFMSKNTGAPEDDDLEDWIFKSQTTQAEGLRQALERHRTSDGRYAGSLYWSLNDVWPAVSWSTIDHAGRWKLGHYAAKRANAPQTALWQRHRDDTLVMVVFNELPQGLSGTLSLALCNFSGDTLLAQHMDVDVEATSSLPVHVAPMSQWTKRPRDSYLTWALTRSDGSTVDRQSALWVPMNQANLLPANVQCQATADGWSLQSNTYVPVVQLMADIPGHWSDNGMALEPGKVHVVDFNPDVPHAKLDNVTVRTLNPERVSAGL